MKELRRTALGLMAILAVITASGQSVWNATNGFAANTNWQSAANWLPSGVPGAATNVKFFNNGAATPGGINNVLTANLTVGSLQYGQTNSSHTTLIAPEVMLTILNGLTAGGRGAKTTHVGRGA